MPYHTKQIRVGQSVSVLKALASKTRADILELLAGRDMNINELSQALGVAQSTVTKHVQILEEAGLVTSDYLPGSQGLQKRCHRVQDRIVVDLSPEPRLHDAVAEIEVPVGMYTRIQARPTCGLASREKFIGILDDPLTFSFPDRREAQLLWSGGGFVEYAFPNILPATVEIVAVDLELEIASEAPGYNAEYPSDITFWINDVEIGTWTSPGDLGGTRGRLNPPWWHDYFNQFGVMKIWTITREGTSLDGERVSDVTLEETKVAPWQATKVRIGVKPDAANQGGFSLFGAGFGNYEQDILLRLHYVAHGSLPSPVPNPWRPENPPGGNLADA